MSSGDLALAFQMQETWLQFEPEKSILLCRARDDAGKKLWAKKIPDALHIDNVLEDDARYYLAVEFDETSGQFLALSKEGGNTFWFIPGKSFLQLLYQGSLYFIFIDQQDEHYLIKVNPVNGSKFWHHRVEQDLREYLFLKKTVELRYASGRREFLSLETGKPDDTVIK